MKKNNIVLVITLICIVSVIVFFVINKKDTKDFLYDDNVTVGSMTDQDAEELRKKLQEETDNSAIAFSINTVPELKDSNINLLFENPEGNDKDLVIEIIDNTTSESIFKSAAIQQGSYLGFAAIGKNYDKGIHKATAYITAYKTDNHDVIGQAAAELDIHVN